LCSCCLCSYIFFHIFVVRGHFCCNHHTNSFFAEMSAHWSTVTITPSITKYNDVLEFNLNSPKVLYSGTEVVLQNRSNTSLSSNRRRAKKESSRMHCASP
jgi:hypothetical protein